MYGTEQLGLAWQIAPQWRLDLTIPRVEIDSGKVSREGFGDASLFATFTPWAEKEGSLLAGVGFIAGLKAPTGEEADQIDVANPTPPSLLQEGTGTWDPSLGYRFAMDVGDFHLYQSTLAQITGGASDIGFEPGNVLVVRLGAAVTLWKVVTSGLSLEGEFRAPDELLGNELSFTGASMWSATPSLAVELFGRLEIGVSARIPFYYNVHGTQLVPGEFLGVSVAVRF